MAQKPDLSSLCIDEDELVPEVDSQGNVIGYNVVVGSLVIPIHDVHFGFMPDPKRYVPAVRDMEVFEDDVFICTVPKSGTHWLSEIAAMVVRNTTSYKMETIIKTTIEFHTSEELCTLPRPRVLNAHLPVDHLPKQLFEKRCKVLWMQRNPKDRIVSLYNHSRKEKWPYASKMTLENFLHLDMSGQGWYTPWYDYVYQFEGILDDRSDHILPLFYEDMIQDPASEIQKIASFLEKPITKTFAKDVAEKCSMTNIRKAEQQRNNAFDFIFRKGEVGDWKNWFTVSQNERYDVFIAEKMKNSRFHYQFSKVTDSDSYA